MRALRINDFTLSPPKLKKRRESLIDAELLDKEIAEGKDFKHQN